MSAMWSMKVIYGPRLICLGMYTMSNLLGDEIRLRAAIDTSSYSLPPYLTSIHTSFLLELKSNYE